jgi:hypothetical protein
MPLLLVEPTLKVSETLWTIGRFCFDGETLCVRGNGSSQCRSKGKESKEDMDAYLSASLALYDAPLDVSWLRRSDLDRAKGFRLLVGGRCRLEGEEQGLQGRDASQPKLLNGTMGT